MRTVQRGILSTVICISIAYCTLNTLQYRSPYTSSYLQSRGTSTSSPVFLQRASTKHDTLHTMITAQLDDFTHPATVEIQHEKLPRPNTLCLCSKTVWLTLYPDPRMKIHAKYCMLQKAEWSYTGTIQGRAAPSTAAPYSVPGSPTNAAFATSGSSSRVLVRHTAERSRADAFGVRTCVS